jgi:hypothetical protein
VILEEKKLISQQGKRQKKDKIGNKNQTQYLLFFLSVVVVVQANQKTNR